MPTQDLTVTLGADLAPLLKALQDAASVAGAAGSRISAALEAAGAKMAASVGADAKQVGDTIGKNVGEGADRASKRLEGLAGKFGEVGKVALGMFGGGLMLQGAQGVGHVFETVFDKGKEVLEIAEQASLGFQQAGLSGAALASQLAHTNKFATALGDAFAIDNDRVVQVAGQVAFLGGVTGEQNDHITKLAVGLEKATGGMLTAEQAVRVFTKGAKDPEAEASLGRLAVKFPALASALKDAQTPAEMTNIALAKLAPTFATLEEQSQGPLGAMTRFRERLSDVAEGLGVAFLTVLTPIFNGLAAFAGVLRAGIEPVLAVLSRLLIPIGVGMAAMAVALYGDAAASAIAAGAKGAYAVVVGLATAANWAFIASLLANPVFLIIAGLVAATAGVMALAGAFRQSAESRKADADAMVDARQEIVRDTESRNSEAASNAALADSTLALAGARTRTAVETATMRDGFERLRQAYPEILTAEAGTAEGTEQLRQVMVRARGDVAATTEELRKNRVELMQARAQQAQADLEVVGDSFAKLTSRMGRDFQQHMSGAVAAAFEKLQQGDISADNLKALREGLAVMKERGTLSADEYAQGLKLVGEAKEKYAALREANRAAQEGVETEAEGAKRATDWAAEAGKLAGAFDEASQAAQKAVKSETSAIAETLREERALRAKARTGELSEDERARLEWLARERAQRVVRGREEVAEAKQLKRDIAAAEAAIGAVEEKKKPKEAARRDFDERRRVIEEGFAQEKADLETALAGREITQAEYRDAELTARARMHAAILTLEKQLAQKTAQTQGDIAHDSAEERKNSYADAVADATAANDRMAAETKRAAAAGAITKDAADARARAQESEFRAKLLEIARTWGQDEDASLRAYLKAREDQQIAADERDAKRREQAQSAALSAAQYHADAEITLTAEGRARDMAEYAKWYSDQLQLVMQGQARIEDVRRLSDRRLRDIDEKYAEAAKAAGKLAAVGFASPMAQLFDWLDAGWKKSMRNQETVLFKALAAMTSAVKQAITNVVQGAFERLFTSIATDAPKAFSKLGDLAGGIGDVFASLGKWIWKGVAAIGEWIASVFLSESALKAKSATAIATTGAETAASTAAIATTTAAATAAAGVTIASMTAIAAAASAAATLTSIATFGGAAAAGEAAVLAAIAATRGAMMFAKGGLAVIGERGPEVVAPAQDFSHLMGLVARQTAEATRAALALPSAAGAPPSDLAREIRGLRDDVKRQRMRVEVDTKISGKMRASGSDLSSAIRQRAREQARVV